jgi:hypothetical protein
MNRPESRSVRRTAPRVVWAAALIAGFALLWVAGTARGAASRQQAAAVDLTQTCSPKRVKAGATVAIRAVLANTGDVAFTAVTIAADAGSPLDESDDFTPQLQSGDDGDGVLEPAERWTYVGSYAVPDEDVTNIVAVEAAAPDVEPVDDLADCETDVIQQPQPGVIVGAKPVSGKVLVKVPGESRFVELDGQTEIPVGSRVDTTRGTINLTAGLGGGRTNSSRFNAGRFTILQGKARNSFMTLRLEGGNFRACGRSSLSTLGTEARRKRPVRKLWGNGKGRFTTKGRYSSATVRGTRWLVQDRCDGTLTRVLSGVVRVQDFRARRTVNVRAGRSYFAKAPGA